MQPATIILRLLGAVLALAATVTAPAQAATFGASELSYDNAVLTQFNLVNLRNFNTSNETEGRILVGGNATVNGSTNVCFNGGCGGNTTFGASSGTAAGAVAASASNRGYGALTVFGNVIGGYSVMNGGDIDVGGTSNGTYNLNGKGAFDIVGSAAGTTVQAPAGVATSQSTFAGTVQNANGVTPKVNQTVASVFPFSASVTTNFTTPLTNLSKGIAALPGTPGVKKDALPAGNNVFLTSGADYTANGKTYGVVTTTLANLAAEQNFGGVTNGAGDAATFVIVTGDGANYLLPNLNNVDSKVLYVFVDAATLRFAGTWNESVLAPLATITQQGGVLNGSIVVAAITQTNELHQSGLFSGDLSGLSGLSYGSAAVPEPPSWVIVAPACLLALLRTLRYRQVTGAERNLPQKDRSGFAYANRIQKSVIGPRQRPSGFFDTLLTIDYTDSDKGGAGPPFGRT